MNFAGQRKVVVIGYGMAAHRLIEQLAGSPHADRFDVTVIGEEVRPAYDRVQLSTYFAGVSADALELGSVDLLEQRGWVHVLGQRVTRVDTTQKTVFTAERAYPYDDLVLATGSSPFVPPIPGSDLPGCFVYRTIEDLESIREAAASISRGVVIGGGLLGLEAANALRNLGLEAHIVEMAPRLMPRQVDAAGGAMLRRLVEALSLNVHVDAKTRAIERSADGLVLRFEGHAPLETEMVVFSAGITPRDELARSAGMDVAARGGVVIDDWGRTSARDVYAIGECASHDGRIYGLVAPANRMADVVAAQLEGDADVAFKGGDVPTKLKLFGVDVASFGDAHAQTKGALTYALVDELGGTYKKIVVDAKRRTLLGGILVGDAEAFGTLSMIAAEGLALPPNPEQLIAPVGSSDSGFGAAALPDSAQLCSCNNVSIGAVRTAVGGGCRTVRAIKEQTAAGTGCGGCLPTVNSVLLAELEKAGIAVDRSLCEHFSQTRQQLYEIVRVEGFRTFESLRDKYGSGDGCEICRPTIASILASTWNEYILRKDHAGLQDTNDYFLANMQRDGTYSIVPRVPGGEITPDKLAVLAAVAKKFDLYTKITGAQRIDLFGAELHQLPQIWRELVDAGFESGHAYGKALRTVKSCVGDTWCRFGVQDSVGLAIRLEHRYRGIRAPHKLKMAVSGCTRECAEAQGKDVGVIATENGYNLYVGGNGGMTPRHAELLATDIDEPTLIRYIDRFLMFYIKNADRLQRTARWIESLEGGLDHVRQVVVEDALGLASTLETQMQHLVDTYECEWKKTLSSPDALRRFRTFVNQDGGDDSLEYVRERGQRRPAYAHERRRKLEVIQ